MLSTQLRKYPEPITAIYDWLAVPKNMIFADMLCKHAKDEKWEEEEGVVVVEKTKGSSKQRSRGLGLANWG